MLSYHKMVCENVSVVARREVKKKYDDLNNYKKRQMAEEAYVDKNVEKFDLRKDSLAQESIQ